MNTRPSGYYSTNCLTTDSVSNTHPKVNCLTTCRDIGRQSKRQFEPSNSAARRLPSGEKTSLIPCSKKTTSPVSMGVMEAVSVSVFVGYAVTVAVGTLVAASDTGASVPIWLQAVRPSNKKANKTNRIKGEYVRFLVVSTVPFKSKVQTSVRCSLSIKPSGVKHSKSPVFWASIWINS